MPTRLASGPKVRIRMLMRIWIYEAAWRTKWKVRPSLTNNAFADHFLEGVASIKMALVGKRVISTWTPSLRGLLSHRHNKKICDYQYRVSFLPYCEKAFTFESTFYNSLCLRRTDKTLSGQKRAHTSTVVFGSYHLRQESISIYHNTTQHIPYHITQPSTITGKG